MRIAVNLLWVKPSQMGGVESYVHNLLDGFVALPDSYRFVLLTSKTNHHTFLKYESDERFEIRMLPVDSFRLFKTVIWENLHLTKYVEGLNVNFCFVPYYRSPIILTQRNVRYVIVLHDLMALHFPQYFSRAKYWYLKNYWKRCLNKAYKVITISNFVKNDIVKQYAIDQGKVKVIYNPIVKTFPKSDFATLADQYGIGKGKYFYTVSSLYKHKNLMTIVRAFSNVNKANPEVKLVISGISGNAGNEIHRYLNEYNLERSVVLTGFISDEIRNSLMFHAKAFLFPSTFEGFGMPPIEAHRLGTKVVTTKCGSIPEVTEGHTIYVDDPYSTEEWADIMLRIDDYPFYPYDFPKYNPEIIAKDYLAFFQSIG